MVEQDLGTLVTTTVSMTRLYSNFHFRINDLTAREIAARWTLFGVGKSAWTVTDLR